MKTPSTSDLTHAQANNAYDRLAVISDHMPMLHELCDFIFDLQDWLKANQHKFLQEFIDNMNNELEKVKADLESLALTHDTDKIALQNAINNINSSITNLTELINQVDDKTVGLLIHNLNPSDDVHGATCMAIAEYVSAKVAVLVGNLGNVSTSLDSILSRLSSLETRVTNLENTVGNLGSGSSDSGYRPRLYAYYIGDGNPGKAGVPVVGEVYTANVLSTTTGAGGDSTYAEGLSHPSNDSRWRCTKVGEECTITVASGNGIRYISSGGRSSFVWDSWTEE